jgi:ketosteroid isomerase-like protein
VTPRPAGAGPPLRLAGHTLSVLRRQPGGGWAIYRDANLLAPTPDA